MIFLSSRNTAPFDVFSSGTGVAPLEVGIIGQESDTILYSGEKELYVVADRSYDSIYVIVEDQYDTEVDFWLSNDGTNWYTDSIGVNPITTPDGVLAASSFKVKVSILDDGSANGIHIIDRLQLVAREI